MQYKDDLEKLAQRSVRGIARTVRTNNGVLATYPVKPALSPEKVKAVRSRYNERIRKNCIDSVEFAKRISDVYFNKLLNTVLSNHGRKRQTD